MTANSKVQGKNRFVDVSICHLLPVLTLEVFLVMVTVNCFLSDSAAKRFQLRRGFTVLGNYTNIQMRKNSLVCNLDEAEHSELSQA